MFPIAAATCVLARSSRQLGSRELAALAGVLVVLGAYLAARYAVLGSLIGASADLNIWAWLLTSLNDFGRLLLIALLPWVQRVFVWAGDGPGRFTWYAIVGGLFLLGLPLAIRRCRWSHVAASGWLWSAIMLLPFAGLAGFGPVGRLLYIPGIGLLILALHAVRTVTRAVHGIRSVALVAALGYWVLLALLVLPGRMMVWKDGYMLFRQMTEQAPQYPAAHFNYAFQLRQRGDVDAAIAEYRKAIALDPNMALAYSNLAALLQSKGELAEAESLYLRTIDLLPGYSLAWNNLAIVRYKRGDGPGAIRAFWRAIELRPNDGGALYNLGRVYQQAGMRDSAALLFERAYRLEPGNAQVRASYEQTRGRLP